MSEEVVLEFTPSYAQAVEGAERMSKLYYPPRLRWPEFARVPYFFVGVAVAIAVATAVGDVARRVAGSSAQFWVSLLTTFLVIALLSWVWALLVRRGVKTNVATWLEKTYGPPKFVRVTADTNGIVWQADTYVASAKWSGIQGIETLDDAIFVRSWGVNIFLSREAFSGPAQMTEVANALTAYWTRSRAGSASSSATL